MKRFPLLVLTLLLLIIANVAPRTSYAQEPSPFYWEFIKVDIDLQDNGDTLVTETQKFLFTRTYNDTRIHYIPLDKVDDIRNMHVSDVHLSGEGERVHVETDKESDLAQLQIRFGHSSIQGLRSHTWEIKYRVVGGLQITDNGDRILWKALQKDREAPIQRLTATVRLPESIEVLTKQQTPLPLGIERPADHGVPSAVRFRSLGVPADARQLDRRTVEFVTRSSLQTR